MSGALELDAHGLVSERARPAIPGDLPASVADVLSPGLARCPDVEALVGRSGRLSYRALDAHVQRAAHALVALDVRPGDRVAACLPNDIDIVVAFLASQRIGALWVGVNRALALPEKEFILADAGARLLIAEAADARPIRDSGQLAAVLTVGPGARGDDWRALCREQPDSALDLPPIDPHAPAAIAYTSGTTGRPKGAVHSQHNLLLPGAVAVLTDNRPRPARAGVVLPLTILNLVVLGPLCAFIDARCCVCIDRIDPVGLAGWVRRESVGSFDGVPTIFHDLLTHPEVSQDDLAALTQPISGGAEATPETTALYRERFGSEIMVGYGMTEAPSAVAWSDPSRAPSPGLCGRAAPQVVIEIVADDGSVLPPNEVGEICVRARRHGPLAGVYTPMLGYWQRPDATREALRGGRYHSGDLGRLAEDGDLFIEGRRNELILRGGANVYPAEVERVLAEHPSVDAAAVLGIPDARLGQRVVAAVEIAPGAALEIDELARYVAERLARYKRPARIEVVAELPRNAMRKIVKPRLRPLFEGPARRSR